MATNYIILPFVVAKRGGKLVPCPPQKAKDADARHRRRRAHGRAVRRHRRARGGSSDPEQDIYAEPRLLRAPSATCPTR